MRHFIPTVLLACAATLSSAAQARNADEPLNSLRLSYAKSSETDFVTVVVGDFQESPESNDLLDLTWGRRIRDTLFGLPFPLSAHIGVQRFNERGYQPDSLGATAFIRAEYTWYPPLIQHPIRFGLGEGLSYVSRIPMSERRDFAAKGVQSEKLMNYLHWTIDVPFRLTGPGGVRELSVGFVVFHRSSVFGLFAEKGGGVNFMGLGVEARY